jgi:hypothetical protein
LDKLPNADAVKLTFLGHMVKWGVANGSGGGGHDVLHEEVDWPICKIILDAGKDGVPRTQDASAHRA